MKKTIFVLGVVIAAIAFAACGNKSTTVTPVTDSTTVVADSLVVDTTAQAN